MGSAQTTPPTIVDLVEHWPEQDLAGLAVGLHLAGVRLRNRLACEQALEETAVEWCSGRIANHGVEKLGHQELPEILAEVAFDHSLTNQIEEAGKLEQDLLVR